MAAIYSSDIQTIFWECGTASSLIFCARPWATRWDMAATVTHGVDTCAGGKEGCIRHVQVADLHIMRNDWQHCWQLRHASFWQLGHSLGGHRLTCCARP